MSYWLPDYTYAVTPHPRSAAALLGAAGITPERVESLPADVGVGTPGILRFMVADSVSKAAVDAALVGYDPAAPDADQVQAAQDNTTFSTLQTQYQTLKEGLVTIRTHLDTIQAQADPTVVNLAALVATGHAVKQLAGDMETLTNGLDRVLDALAALVRRAHG